VRPKSPGLAANAAYIDGLKMLGRRELSEQQVRQRLARKQYQQDEIDEAIARLREERAINDQRVAEAIARTETGIRKRGKVRVRMQLERAGIAKDTAKQAIDDVFESIDSDELLEASLRKRLHGREHLADDREFQRLFRYLIGQGFESDRVLHALRAKRK
jgi:regulatory protein